MPASDMYQEAILELARHPLNKKKLPRADVAHHATNPSCGDDVAIEIAFDSTDRVSDIGYSGDGCAISQAAVSLVTDACRGKTRDEILRMTDKDVYDLLGIEVMYTRKNCALLGLSAIQQALRIEYDK